MHGHGHGHVFISTNAFLMVTDIKKIYAHVRARSCLSLCNPMDCSQPGSSAHGILQARILEPVAISSSRGSS